MWWTFAVACFSDPLSSAGLSPVAEVPPEPVPEPLVIPTTPPMDGEKVTGEGAAGGAPVEGGSTASAAPAPAPPPKEYNPISIPQGPRKEGGVRWEGVSRSTNEKGTRVGGSAAEEEAFGRSHPNN